MFVVHCRVKPGGALNVLEALIIKNIRHGQSVDAIFTLYSDRDRLIINNEEGRIDRTEGKVDIPIVTALPKWLNSIFRRADENKPFLISSIIDYRNLMPFFPVLMKVLSWKLAKSCKLQAIGEKLKLGAGGLKPITTNKIIISSYAVAKNIDIPSGWKSEIYFHQPMHYIWTLYDEYVGSMHGRKKRLYQYITPYLRRRDARPRQYDLMYANSESTQQQIQDIYFSNQVVRGGDSSLCFSRVSNKIQNGPIQIVHPPIAKQFFFEPVVNVPDSYFFYINRLTKLFKHLDKLIHLCNRYQVPLLIAGDGPDKAYLMSIAGPTITFVGRISKIEDKIQLMKRARGVLNVAHESFGIVTAEALLLGVPIFGYQGGATPELVDEKSAILTPSLDEETMNTYFEHFLSTSFDRQAIQDRARAHFSPLQKFWTE